jgi:hypothetical protein
VRRLAVACLAALAVAACGGAEAEAPPPPTLAPSAVPELESAARLLDASRLAADAFEPAKLAALLTDAGFVSGREREFSGKSRTWDHVVARTLRFSTEEGAQAYVNWLGNHADELLGKSERAPWRTPGEAGVAFVLVPCASCKKELPTFLAGWRRETVVATLLAAGPGANEDRFAALALGLDARVTS